MRGKLAVFTTFLRVSGGFLLTITAGIIHRLGDSLTEGSRDIAGYGRGGNREGEGNCLLCEG